MKTVETKIKFENVLWNNSKFEMIYISLVPICWINKISQYLRIVFKTNRWKIETKIKGKFAMTAGNFTDTDFKFRM